MGDTTAFVANNRGVKGTSPPQCSVSRSSMSLRDLREVRLRRPIIATLCASIYLVSGQVRLTWARQDSPRRECVSLAQGQTVRDFGDVSALVSLGRKGLIVVDPIAPEILWVSAGLDSVRSIGREGRGPAEYLQPGQAFRMQGDSVVVFDRALRLFIVLHPQGGIARKIASSFPGNWGAPLGADTTGTLLFWIPRRISGAQPSSFLISTALAGGRIDTLTTLASPDTVSVMVTPAGARFSNTFVLPVPFTAGDAPVLFSGGQVAVLRVSPFRLEVLLPGGGVAQGAAIDYRPVAVSGADRERVQADDVANRLPWARSVYRFPAVKAPFAQMTAVPGPGGTVWVERHQPFGAPGTLYDAIGSAGVVGSCRFPAQTRLWSFEDPATVIAVLTDGDGLKRVARFRVTGWQ